MGELALHVTHQGRQGTGTPNSKSRFS